MSLTVAALSAALDTPRTIEVFESIDSTNTYLRGKSAAGNTLVCALAQTAGRGRRGNQFYSPAGAGVYFSLDLTLPIPIEQMWITTFAAAIAVCRTLQQVGAAPGIKWVNDIFLGGRKVCGILTEVETNPHSGVSRRMVVGIGLNLKKSPLPEGLRNIATSLEEQGILISEEAAVAGIVNEFDRLMSDRNIAAIVQEYRENCFLIGREITFAQNNILYTGIAQDVLDNGNLAVEVNGERVILTSGEISVRPKNEKSKHP